MERDNSWWITVLIVCLTVQGCLQFGINKITNWQLKDLQNQVRELREVAKR